jgi:hypothetical protein
MIAAFLALIHAIAASDFQAYRQHSQKLARQQSSREVRLRMEAEQLAIDRLVATSGTLTRYERAAAEEMIDSQSACGTLAN